MDNTIVAWILQSFFRVSHHALVSRGVQDGGRPVRLTKTGRLDPSLLPEAIGLSMWYVGSGNWLVTETGEPIYIQE